MSARQGTGGGGDAAPANKPVRDTPAAEGAAEDTEALAVPRGPDHRPAGKAATDPGSDGASGRHAAAPRPAAAAAKRPGVRTRDSEPPIGTPRAAGRARETDSSPAENPATQNPATQNPGADEPESGKPKTHRPGSDAAPTDTLAATDPSTLATSRSERPPPEYGVSRPVRPVPRQEGRPAVGGAPRTSSGRSRSTGSRRARLALKRVDPWSVFVLTLAVTFFLGIALVVAIFVLYAFLDSSNVVSSINDVVREVTQNADPVLTQRRALTLAVVLAALQIVLVTLLATLGALLYNLCASFTGGVDVTLDGGDRG